jgi:hydrogenase expression/formation protein HypC
MCLAVPARVIELLPPQDAWVELDGVRQRVSLALLDAVQVGDYVIVHVGFALQVIDEAEAQATLALMSELQRELPPPSLP